MNHLKTLNMTEGRPGKLLLAFTIPMLIGNIFQQLYSMVDSIVVGQYVGSNALAAVGATGSINFFFFSFSFGLAAGIGVVVSQYFGARNDKQVMKTIANSIYVLSTISIVMSILGILLARIILVAMNTPIIILENSILYMRVTCAGIIAVSAYNGVSSILRALGDSKTPLLFLVVASFINIALDLLFVISFNWGVFGVAIATIISQTVAAIGCIIYAYQKIAYFRIPKEFYEVDRELVIKCIKIGIPVSFQNSLIAVSCIALQSVVNSFGETVVAAFTASGRFEQLIQQPFNSLGAAVVTYTGQNIGAGKVDRVKKGFWAATIMCAIFSLIMLPVAYFGSSGIMRMFVSDLEVIQMGARAIRITAFFYFTLGMIYVSRAVLNGAGDAAYAMINGLVEITGRVGLARPLTMIPAIGYWGVWYTTGLTWLITGTISCIRYAGGKWKTKTIIN
ncbi:MAG TPA: MATE family efflux transporter [Lachnospiraceae bacterium]|nr:MATE family efflux transporter [Lachnospiraceae bacterium]